MEGQITLDDDYRLWVLLNQVNDGMARARDGEVKGLGISAIQSGAIIVLKAMDGEATPTELSRWLFREPQTISQLLIRMEKQGFVKRVRRRKRNREDSTMLRVVLTQKGEDIYRQENAQRKVIQRIMSCLSPEQRQTFGKCLEKLRTCMLEELAVKPRLPFP